ncbi:TOBE domain-containing protein [Echinicola shivajiensis]|uniref:TOBE domain-containing protein n=1 Tax=Echinicola shivajiensis TaxID=1035916 RepID=UPI001BFC31A4|nr:TOBE domain-containing protein [Echinicola shivajiensis]
MNQFEGKITGIQSSEHMSLVLVDLGEGVEFHSILLDTVESAHYLQKGKKVNILFKETELVLSKEEKINISIENKILGTITEIKKGEILTRVKLNTAIGDLIALISSISSNNMSLKLNDQVLTLIKFNEVILSPL